MVDSIGLQRPGTIARIKPLSDDKDKPSKERSEKEADEDEEEKRRLGRNIDEHC